jgi:hypothetical protein
MHNIKACRQMVPHTAFPQCCRVFGITIKSYYSAQLTHQPRDPEGQTSYMRANIVDDSAGPNCGADCRLHLGLMFSSPVARFIRKAKPHPHALRQPSLRLYPNLLVRRRVAFNQRLKSRKPSH